MSSLSANPSQDQADNNGPASLIHPKVVRIPHERHVNIEPKITVTIHDSRKIDLTLVSLDDLLALQRVPCLLFRLDSSAEQVLNLDLVCIKLTHGWRS